MAAEDKAMLLFDINTAFFQFTAFRGVTYLESSYF